MQQSSLQGGEDCGKEREEGEETHVAEVGDEQCQTGHAAEDKLPGPGWSGQAQACISKAESC